MHNNIFSLGDQESYYYANSARNSASTMDSHTGYADQFRQDQHDDDLEHKVRRKEIAADTAPLFRAVKKEEPPRSCRGP